MVLGFVFFFLFLYPHPCLLAFSIGQLQEDLTIFNMGKKKKEPDRLLILRVKERHRLGHRALCLARSSDERRR